MFLSIRSGWLGGLFFGCLVLTPALAAADPQQCVQQSNAGAELRDRHQMLAARTAYRACATEDECPAVVRAECDAALQELQVIIPTLVVRLRDEQGHDLLSGTLLVDGSPVAMDGSALEVDPGVHTLTGISGALRTELKVMVVERDASRLIGILMEPAKPNDECLTLPQASCATPRASSASPAPSVARQRSPVPAYVLGGVAALATTSFAYFALSGHSELQDMAACKPACAPSEVTRVRDKYLAADISLGVSLAALVGAGYWLLSTPSETRSAAQHPLSFAVSAAPRSAGLSLQWVE